VHIARQARAGVGTAWWVSGGLPPENKNHSIPRGSRHLGTVGFHPPRHDEELLLLKELLKPGGHALVLSHDDSPFVAKRGGKALPGARGVPLRGTAHPQAGRARAAAHRSVCVRGTTGEHTVGQKTEVMLQAPVGGTYAAHMTVVDRVVEAASGPCAVRHELPDCDYRLPAGLQCCSRFLQAIVWEPVTPVSPLDARVKAVSGVTSAWGQLRPS